MKVGFMLKLAKKLGKSVTGAKKFKIKAGSVGKISKLKKGMKARSKLKPIPPKKIKTPFKPLTPKQKKLLNDKLKKRTISKEEYRHLDWDRRFNNRRKRGVDRFWSEEKKRLKEGKKGTRNWDAKQKEDIMNGKTPTHNGVPMEGHHKYNALDHPQLADDPKNIYPATNSEHFERWHGGNWQNDTSGFPNNTKFGEEF